ncbi:MAG: GGDEF domain-containing protein [Pirellulales bacterium]
MGSIPWEYLTVATGTDEWLRRLDSGFPITVALAAIALVGYLFGQRTRRGDPSIHDSERARELERASGIARKLETIAESLRHDLASHHGRLTDFRRRLYNAKTAKDDAAWKQLCEEAEELLSPTLQLAEQISMAYDSIRQQSDALETFTQARIDPCTGVGNGRALDEKLDAVISASRRGGTEFALTLVSIDHKAAAFAGDELIAVMAELGRLIRGCMRQCDFVARYGDDEFAIVMPQTKLAGAGVFGERLRQMVADELQLTVSCGIAQFQDGDDVRSLLSRADSALYSARAAGANKQFVHNGAHIRERRDENVRGERPTPSSEPAAPSLASADLQLMTSGEPLSH